jgi:pilus assembly protein CpaF
VVIPPLAVGGPFVAIRRFSTRSLPLSAFAEPPLVARIAELIDGRANIVVFGPTGSGKTTLLNALASSLPAGRRIITIEDTAELRIAHPHVIGLEARTANAEGAGAASIRSLIRAALRMRPDHLVVGEVRGAEALDMIWALSTGHDGSLSTCHASSADDVLARLETFALLGDAALPHEAIRRQLRAAVDVVIGVRRREDGRRTISEVASVSRDLNGAPTVSLLDGSAKRDAP